MPAPVAYDPTGVEYFSIPDFKFSAGSTHSVKIAYRVHNPACASQGTVCIPTCYGGRVNTTQTFADNGNVFSKYRVVVVAMLGNGESSSPSNDDHFPTVLKYEDCVRSQYRLLTEHLEVRELEAVMGFSMGGQQTYYWAVLYPDFLKNAIVVCGSARTSGHNIAFLEGPKGALMNSVDYADGQYRAKGVKPERGLKAFGRAYSAWLTSAAWFRERMYEKTMGCGSVEEYIVTFSEQGFLSWDAEDLLILARMWQMGDVGNLNEEHKGDYTKALESVKARMLIMPGRTDQYFPPEDSEIELKHLKHGELAPIESIFGHAAGGGLNPEDSKWMNERITRFLQQRAG